MLCPRCNASVSSFNMVCPECGASLRHGSESLPQEEREAERRESDDKRSEVLRQIREEQYEKERPEAQEKKRFHRALIGAGVSLLIVNIGSHVYINYSSSFSEGIVGLFAICVAAMGTKCIRDIILYMRNRPK